MVVIEKFGYTFRYFFNAGYDRITNECDLEGVDVYKDDHYIGMLKWVLPSDLKGMEEEEIEHLFELNGIIV